MTGLDHASLNYNGIAVELKSETVAETLFEHGLGHRLQTLETLLPADRLRSLDGETELTVLNAHKFKVFEAYLVEAEAGEREREVRNHFRTLAVFLRYCFVAVNHSKHASS